MTERLNRRGDIVDAAAGLFMRQGYAATSVREIAAEVGCTEAALYYHFKAGKRELLQAVVEGSAPDLTGVVDAVRGARSLPELVTQFGDAILQLGRQKTAQLRWVASEFTSFSDDACGLIHAKHLAMQQALCEQVSRFVADEDEASRIAWLMIFTVFGYGHLFLMQQLADADATDPQRVIATLAEALGVYVDRSDARTAERI